MRVLTHFGARSVQQIIDALPGVDALEVPSSGPVPEGVTGDALVTLATASDNLADLLTRGVTWVHTIGTGVDRFPLELIGDGITLTCSRGASAVPIAEWALAAMLAHEKQFPESWITEPLDDWDESGAESDRRDYLVLTLAHDPRTHHAAGGGRCAGGALHDRLPLRAHRAPRRGQGGGRVAGRSR